MKGFTAADKASFSEMGISTEGPAETMVRFHQRKEQELCDVVLDQAKTMLDQYRRIEWLRSALFAACAVAAVELLALCMNTGVVK